MPFAKAEKENQMYRLLFENDAWFWQVMEKGKTSGFYSDDFKQLVSEML